MMKKTKAKQASLDEIFRCDDQSALLDNYVASEDVPPGAWSHHSGAQSPLGKVSFPEVLTLVRGEVYTRGSARDGEIVSQMTTSSEWVPWLYAAKNRNLSVERTVTRDTFVGRFCMQKKGPAMLLIQCSPAGGLKIIVERRKDGLLFRWGKSFEIYLTFTGRVKGIDVNDDPAPLKRKFAGFDDVRINEAHCTGWAWTYLKNLWISVEFDRELELCFAVRRPGAKEPTRVPFDRAMKAQRKRWEDFFRDQVPPLQTKDRAIRDTYYFAWQTIWANRCEGGSGALKSPYISPARLSYGSEWWWDEAFQANVIRHLKDPKFTYHLFENFWRAQGKDGNIPGSLKFTDNETGQDKNAISHIVMAMQPPVAGLTFQLLKDKPGWPKNLRPIYDGLRRHAGWLLNKKRDTDQDGLTEYHHSFDGSADQSQRWDSQKINPADVIGPLRPTESVDANIWLSLMFQDLSEMAARLGETRASREHADRARTTFGTIERLMWDDNDSFYYDIDGLTHKKIRVKTHYGFMPLLSPFMKKDRAQRLVKEHLLNPKEFWCRYPLPSASLDQPDFDPINMWRGPTWVNVNWMVIEGLHRQGFESEAKELTRRTMELVGPRYKGTRRVRSPRIWEWYHPHTGEPLGNHQYSWTALVVDLILRYGV